MVLQLVLLRELLVIFHGNDLVIGIILANWLAAEALGAFFVGKRIEGARDRVAWFIALSTLVALSGPLSLYLVYSVRDLFGVLPGVGMGTSLILYASLLIVLLPSLLHGALFIFACKLGAQLADASAKDAVEGSAAVGRVYVWETIGHVVGAAAATFLLIPLFNALAIVLCTGILTLIATAGLVTLPGLAQRGRALAALAIVLIPLGYLLVGDGANRLHQQAIARQWPGQKVIHHQHSFYGNVAVIERGGEYTFLSDGLPVLTSPTPDIVRVEDFVHFAMLAHPSPEYVAILSGGAGGVIGQILQYPTVTRVDYAELDPLLIDLVRRFPTAETEAELTDPRVHTLHVDGRRFLMGTSQRYDLILVGAPNPANLQLNRLFTAEFATLARGRLRDGGILVLSLPGSLTYLSHELRNLNAVIINTLAGAFPYVRVIPGDYNILLASTSPTITTFDAALLYSRLRERQLSLRLFTRPYLELRLDPNWLDWFSTSLEGATQEVNRDFRPKGFFYSLALWNALFSPYMRPFFSQLEGLGLLFPAALIAAVTTLLATVGRRTARLRQWAIPYSIATTGFAGMVLDLLLIFSFQALFGFVLQWVGLLVAAFMGGVALGGLVMSRALARVSDGRALFIRLELSVALFALLLPLATLAVAPHVGDPTVSALTQALFLLLSCGAGALVGLQFPLANRICLASSPDLSRTAGLVYSADLAGGWSGGIVAAVVMLPVLGLLGAALVVALLKASSLVVLMACGRGQ